MEITFTAHYSKEFKEAYKDLMYPMKDHIWQTINTDHFNMPVPRVGDRIQSFPMHTRDDTEVYDLIVTNVVYELIHGSDGLFVQNQKIGETYHECQSRITVYFTEYRASKLEDKKEPTTYSEILGQDALEFITKHNLNQRLLNAVVAANENSDKPWTVGVLLSEGRYIRNLGTKSIERVYNKVQELVKASEAL